LKYKLAAVLSPRVVEESPEATALCDVLYVAWIEVVEEVEYSKPNSRLDMSIAQMYRDRT
jgi:hypothetical protein